MPKLVRKTVIGIKQETTQGSAAAVGATDFILAQDVTIKPNVEQLDREYYTSSLDPLPSIAGKRWYEIDFKLEAKGSGVAGTAYEPLAAALEACGMVRTVHTGSEAIGAAVADGGNLGVSPAPVVEIGTPAFSALSGTLELTLTAKVEDSPEGATFEGIFYPNDGSDALVGNATVSDTAFTDVAFDGALTSLTLTTNDPDAGGVGLPVSTWRTGDKWTFAYTSADQVDVSLAPTSAPASANFYGPGKSISIEVYQDGIKHVAAGCLGTWKFSAEAGKFGMFEFKFFGVYAAPSDTAPGTQTYLSQLPAPLFSSGLTIHTFAAIANKIEIDSGVTVAQRPDTRSATGLLGFIITERKPVGNIDPELDTVANFNIWSKLLASTEGVLTFALGSTAGNIITFSHPKAQILPFSYGDRNALRTAELPLKFNRSSGDDWCSIVFT